MNPYFSLVDGVLIVSRELNENAIANWEVTPDRSCLWKAMTEALAMGADEQNMWLFCAKHNMTGQDMIDFISRYTPSLIARKGLFIFIQNYLKVDVDDFFKWLEGNKTPTFTDYIRTKSQS